MNFTPASHLTLLLFLVIVLWNLVCPIAGVYTSARKQNQDPKSAATRALVFLLGWIGILSVLSLSGLVENNPMPSIPIFFAIVLLGAVAFALSRFGRLLTSSPVFYLVIFQGFRFPLELILHSWANEGTIPPTMTWTGQNFDVIAGVLSILLSSAAAASRKVAWAVNVIGIVCLFNVMRVAVLSSPLPFAWELERPLVLAAHFPYYLVGPLAIGAALSGHVILTRKLLGNSDRSPNMRNSKSP